MKDAVDRIEKSTGRHRSPYAKQSCIACRKRKVRCVWPQDLNAVGDNLSTQENCCRRCSVKSIDCIFEHKSTSRAAGTSSRMSSKVSGNTSLQYTHHSDGGQETTDRMRCVIEETSFFNVRLNKGTSDTARASDQMISTNRVDECMLGKPFWRLKQLTKLLISDLPQLAHRAEVGDDCRSKHNSAFRINQLNSTFIAWNPFLCTSGPTTASSLLNRVVQHITSTRYHAADWIQDLMQLTLTRRGSLQDAQALLLIALYEPIDFNFGNVERHDDKSPLSFDLLNICNDIMKNNGVKDLNGSCNENITWLSLFVAKTVVGMSCSAGIQELSPMCSPSDDDLKKFSDSIDMYNDFETNTAAREEQRSVN